MDNILKIKVIAGSVREGRFNDKPATWITDELRKQEGVDVELLDLKEYEMPFFDAPQSPNFKQEPYTHPVVAKWTDKIAEADGFVMVTPEYNHSMSAVLKNAIDWVGPEWNNKPVSFVSYGSTGGSRAVEALRLIAGELQMADIKNAVLIPGSDFFPVLMGQAKAEDLFAKLGAPAQAMIDQLLWWTKTLKNGQLLPPPIN